jgi:hypothetical protein
MQALSLAKDCYRMKLELLDSETIIDDAIQFVESRKEKQSDENLFQEPLSPFPEEDGNAQF